MPKQELRDRLGQLLAKRLSGWGFENPIQYDSEDSFLVTLAEELIEEIDAAGYDLIERKAELDLSGVLDELDKLDWNKVNREVRESRARRWDDKYPSARIVGTNVQVNVKW